MVLESGVSEVSQNEGRVGCWGRMAGVWRRNSLTILVVVVVGLAFLVPEAGRRGGWLRSEWTVEWAIFLIFLLQGLSIEGRVLLRGLLSVRLHLFVQGWVFVGTPLLGLGLSWFGRWWWPEMGSLWDGVLFLGILPTTVSSAVAFTTMGGGNVVGSVFNTTLANFIGVALTPAWAFLVFSGREVVMPPVGPVLVKLGYLILLPLVLGQVLRPIWVTLRIRGILEKRFRSVSSGLILFIVFCAFSGSVAAGGWQNLPLSVIVVGLGSAGCLLATATWLVWGSSGWLGLARADRVAGLFSGSQKTLAAGVPMANALFGDPAGWSSGFNFGLFLLPLLAYHPFQLVLAGMLAPRLAAAEKRDQTGPSA